MENSNSSNESESFQIPSSSDVHTSNSVNEVLTINIEDTNEELAINIEEASEELAINTEEVSEEHAINSDEISKELFTNSQEVSEELAINYEQVAKKSIHENDELAINSNEVSEELAINSTHESEEFAIKSANDDEVFDVDSHSFPLPSDNEYEDGTPFMPTIIGRETSPSTVDTFSIGGNTPSTTKYMLHSLGNSCLSRIQECLEKDPSFYSKANVPRTCGPTSNLAIIWLKDFISKHGEIMPNRDTIHIPDNFSKVEIFNMYKEHAIATEAKHVSYVHFKRLWKDNFNNVRIPAKTRMGICSVCAELKARRAKLCGHERDLVTSALQEHREQQARERQKLYKHRKKCYDSPHKYMGLIIDGMDQKKTVLPHFARIPKNMKEENFIQMHLVGCLVFNGHIIPKLDNTSRENKNQVVLAYLNILVELENTGMPPNLLTSHVEAREMYIGARKSHARHKDIYSGSVQDIKVGSMIVVLATNCEHGHLFWIAKVLNLIYKDDKINAIEVHWYSTKTDSLKDSVEEDGSSTSVSKNSYEETPDSDGVSLDDDM
eukprot:Gb_30936 [translate_table: standard]